MATETMKAITLYQPWATLVAIGAKKIETRSWATKYRGPIAIHAGLKFGWDEGILLTQEPFRSVLHQAGIYIPSQLPRGVILATGWLRICLPVEHDQMPYRLTARERAFGDYTPGRFAWQLDDIKLLEAPVPALGRHGLWDATAVLSAAGVTW